jgi:hypothetical protein
MAAPDSPKIYHIVHEDRIASIVSDGFLLCDSRVARRGGTGTTIGMSAIKRRRLTDLTLTSHPELHVGECVPFYFCPRSVMLYLIYQANHPELDYRGGQESIVHLEADLHTVVAWADANRRRWAFTLSNAGARYFEDRSNLGQLDEIDWNAVQATDWRQYKDGKQAEFLLELSFPWQLVERVGVHSRSAYTSAVNALAMAGHRPPVEIRRDWYY